MKHFVILLLLFFTGCSVTHVEQNPNPREAKILDESIANIVSINASTQISTLRVEDNEVDYLISSDIDPNLKFTYFRSTIDNDKHPLIIIYNILKDDRAIISGLIADVLLEAGYDCIIVKQEAIVNSKWARPIIPTPGDRASFDEYNASLARNVKRIVRQWMPYQRQLNGKFGFMGASLGGIHTIGAAALFPDATLSVAIMAGGDNEALFRGSQERLVLSTKEKLIKAYEGKEEQLYEDLRSLTFDVIKFSQYVDTSKVRMIITLRDTSVPTKAQWRLYHKLGGPEARLYPCGHYTLAFFYFDVSDQLVTWLDQAFRPKDR